MAIEVATEDDVFFADLNRQISMLIDEDEDVYVSRFPSISRQELPRVVAHPPTLIPNRYELYQQNRTSETIASKGTGVFIPQSQSQSRMRRYKPHPKRANLDSYASKTNKNKHVTNPKGKSNVNVPNINGYKCNEY